LPWLTHYAFISYHLSNQQSINQENPTIEDTTNPSFIDIRFVNAKLSSNVFWTLCFSIL